VQERRLHELAARLGITRSISFEGLLPDEDLETAYRTSSALVWTSRMEGFGLPPVEAVLRGLPVVAVRTPAATETLEGVAAIVPADPDAIAEAMAHPIIPAESAVSALRERCSINSVARSLADAYRRILD
jgi:glycosyltransferase involved in cell wall biosynthesis